MRICTATITRSTGFGATAARLRLRRKPSLGGGCVAREAATRARSLTKSASTAAEGSKPFVSARRSAPSLPPPGRVSPWALVPAVQQAKKHTHKAPLLYAV